MLRCRHGSRGRSSISGEISGDNGGSEMFVIIMCVCLCCMCVVCVLFVCYLCVVYVLDVLCVVCVCGVYICVIHVLNMCVMCVVMFSVMCSVLCMCCVLVSSSNTHLQSPVFRSYNRSRNVFSAPGASGNSNLHSHFNTSVK